MKIIDMRVRAPFVAYKGCNLFNNDYITPDGYGGARNYKVPQSVRQFSMELLIQEADEANVEKMVVPVRKNLGGDNEDLAALIHQYPERIIGLAGIDVDYMPVPLDDVLGAFPRLKIGLAHGGWPFVNEMCQMAVNRGNLYLAPDFYMIESPGQEDYVRGANYLLKDRLMFASAYPLMPLKESAEYYINSGIKEEILPNIMYKNAAAFLGLQSV